MWTTPHDLKTHLQRLWDKGELLREAFAATSRFPLRLTLKTPSTTDITARFDAVRSWILELSALASPPSGTPALRIVWHDVNHRVQGTQKMPASVWIDTLDDALRWLGRQKDWQHFQHLIAQTSEQCPALLAWLAKRPLQALALAADWPRLLAVVSWVIQNPRPALYLRQVDLPGIHTKFIEMHRAVLAELLDLALPEEHIDTSRSGTGQFAARYGFLDKPVRIRFRLLDPEMRVMAALRCPDVTLDAESFSRLHLNLQRVVITENETNFLALPALPGTLALFGAGYGWEALAQARWLEKCNVFYWGDIDTHGFAILDQLRGHFPHVESLLMDQATLEAHRPFWGREEKPFRGDLNRLNTTERALYDDLRDNRFGDQVRLEQEFTGFDTVQHALQRTLSVSH